MKNKIESAQRAIKKSEILTLLEKFSPVVVSTIFVGLDIEESDIDILCQYEDANMFEFVFKETFKMFEGFKFEKYVDNAVGKFHHSSFLFEVYASETPVEQQMGYRHFQVMKKLCKCGGEEFKCKIRHLKRSGLKTEPAICKLLSLEGDPYQAVLEIEAWSEDEVISRFEER